MEKDSLRLFQFHRLGRGKLPKDYEDVYICDLLNISYTEYIQQPASWIERMLTWHTQKAKAQELAAKEAQHKARR